MKKKKFLLGLFLIALFGLFILSTCKKDDSNTNTDDTDSDLTSSADNSIAEGIYDDVKSIADQADRNSMTGYKNNESTFVSDCATITRDTISTPHVLTIDFGDTNCLCKDNRYRRGEIIVSYNGHYRDSATTITFSFNNYYVNNHQVLGTKTVVNMGRNTSGNIYYRIIVDGSIVKPNNGGTITWVSNRTREWVSGYQTSTWADDVYLITGSGSGVNGQGIQYTTTITKALRIEMSCRWIVSGTFELTPTGRSTRIFDYGDGGCDNQATVTVKSRTHNITLH